MLGRYGVPGPSQEWSDRYAPRRLERPEQRPISIPQRDEAQANYDIGEERAEIVQLRGNLEFARETDGDRDRGEDDYRDEWGIVLLVKPPKDSRYYTILAHGIGYS